MVAPALVLIVVLLAALSSGLHRAGAPAALIVAMLALVAGATLNKHDFAEAGYWLAVGALTGAALSAATRALVRRSARPERDW